MNLLSLLGVDRWIDDWSDRVHQALSEGASGLEARALLARLEWNDEKRRLQSLLIYVLLALGLTLGALLVVSAVLVVHFWDSPYRAGIAWGIALVWVVLWAVSVIAVIRTVRGGNQAFALTRAELTSDWRAFKDRI